MFDLEQSIAEWRRAMAAGGIKSSAVLDELETHLREDIDRDVRSGTGVAQAYDSAVRRLGQVRSIKTEFAKVGEAMPAWQRTMNVVVCVSAAIIYGLLGVVFLFNQLRIPLTFRERVMGAGACVAVAVIICSWRFAYRLLPVIPGKRTRLAVAVLIIIVGSICTALLLQFAPADISGPFPFVIAIVWSLLPLVIAASLIFGLEEAAYRRIAAPEV